MPMNENTLPELIKWVEAFEKLTNARIPDIKYNLECANSLWEMAPFKVGDRVQLAKTPDINKETSWGWLGAKHFLIKGALATVHSRQFYDAHFIFGLYFDNDSWLTPEGVKHMRLPKDRGLYMFRAESLSSVSEEEDTANKIRGQHVVST
jgi:hypothetical protein